MAELEEDTGELLPGEHEEASDLDELMGEIGAASGAWVTVERLNSGGKVFVDKIPSDGFSLKGLQDHYGGGDYILTVRKRGRYVEGGKGVRVTIAPPLRRPLEGAPPSQDPGIVAILEELRRQREPVESKPAPVDPMAMMRETMNMVTTMMAPLLQARPAPAAGLGVAETLQIIAEVKKLQGAGEGGALGKLAELKETIELVEALRGEKNGESGGVMDMLAPFVPVLVEAVKASQLEQQRKAAQRTAPVSPLPAPQVTQEPPRGSGQETEEENGMKGQLKMVLPFAINAARKAGSDEEEIKNSAISYAQIITDNCSDDQREALRQFIDAEDCLAQIIAIDSGVSPYVAWFGELIECLRDHFHPERLTDAPE